jgi:hypothetical protein
VSDPWINRLVVSGPTEEVLAFQKAAQSTDAGKSTSFSFAQLQALLPRAERQGLEIPVDPWDDDSESNGVGVPETVERDTPTMLDLVYRFRLEEYAPDALLVRVSRLFPHVCFVLGWVAPNVGEQASRFVQDGNTRPLRKTDESAQAIRLKVPGRFG